MSNVLDQFLELSKRDQAELAAEYLGCDPGFIATIGKSDSPEKHDPKTAPHIRVKTNHGQVYYIPLDPDADLSDAAVDVPEPDPPADLEALTGPKLKDLCRELGLKVSGNKTALIERITQHQATATDN